MVQLGNLGIIDESELLTETIPFASAGKFSYTKLPQDKDLVALGIDVLGQSTTGAATPVKKPDNPFGILQELRLKGDGDEIWELYDTEHMWFHQWMWGRGPSRKETQVEINAAAGDFFFRTILPVGYRAASSPFKQLTLEGLWGAAADLDSSANFAVSTNPVMRLVAYRGTSMRSFYTKRHTDTVNGAGQKTIPKGKLQAIFLNVTDQTDSIDTLQLIHHGHRYKNYDYETSLMEMKQFYNIDPTYYGSDEFYGLAAPVLVRDYQRFRRSGFTIMEVMGLESDGVNTLIKYKTTANKTLDILYVYEGMPPVKTR